jgi:hypothetical protein
LIGVKEVLVVAIGVVVAVSIARPVSAVVVDSVVVDAVRYGSIIGTKMIAVDPGHATRHHRAADMISSTGHSQGVPATTPICAPPPPRA